jgi:hypothetical protein
MLGTPLTSVVEVLVEATIANVFGRSINFLQSWFWAANVTYPNAATASAVAEAFITRWNAQIPPLLQQDLQQGICYGRYLDDVTYPFAAASTLSAAGSITTARLPSDVSARAQIHTNLRGKNFKGGKSFRPLPEASVVGDELTTTAYNAFTAAMNAMLATLTVSGVTFDACIVSRTLSQLRTNPTTILGAFVNESIMNLSLGTVRGRHRKAVQ